MSETDTYHAYTSTDPIKVPLTSAEAWQALVSPGDVFCHPDEVVAHPTLTAAQKRAILASWASDAHAMMDAPDLRCLGGCKAEPVSLESVLRALKTLDGEATSDGRAPKTVGISPRERRRPRLGNLRRYIRRNRSDDDDDPPPCPAVIMPRPWGPRPAAAALAS